MPEEFVPAIQTADVTPGQKVLVRLGEDQILLVNVDGEYFAMDGVCPHADADLSRGQLYGDEIVCPMHGSAFSVRTGEVLSPPSQEGLTTYQVKVSGDQILIGPSPS